MSAVEGTLPQIVPLVVFRDECPPYVREAVLDSIQQTYLARKYDTGIVSMTLGSGEAAVCILRRIPLAEVPPGDTSDLDTDPDPVMEVPDASDDLRGE